MGWFQVDEEQEDYSCSSSDKDDKDLEQFSTATSQLLDKDAHDDEDSDIDADLQRTHGPKTTSERRKAQWEIMEAFAANINAHVTKQEVEEVASRNANEEQLSIRDILAKLFVTAERCTFWYLVISVDPNSSSSDCTCNV